MLRTPAAFSTQAKRALSRAPASSLATGKARAPARSVTEALGGVSANAGDASKRKAARNVFMRRTVGESGAPDKLFLGLAASGGKERSKKWDAPLSLAPHRLYRRAMKSIVLA